jgi:CRISPR-associated protein Cas2
VVVAYDVTDDARRVRVAKLLEDYGVRVQYSVFECVLGPADYRKLRAELKERMNVAEDAVAFYRLCQGCGARIRRLGRPPPDPDPQFVLL